MFRVMICGLSDTLEIINRLLCNYEQGVAFRCQPDGDGYYQVSVSDADSAILRECLASAKTYDWHVDRVLVDD